MQPGRKTIPRPGRGGGKGVGRKDYEKKEKGKSVTGLPTYMPRFEGRWGVESQSGKLEEGM